MSWNDGCFFLDLDPSSFCGITSYGLRAGVGYFLGPKMDLESEFSVLESVEDNEETTNGYFSEELGNDGKGRVKNNGSCVVEGKDDDTFFPEVKEDGNEALKPMHFSLMDLKPEGPPSSAIATKGVGLKKWRRIKGDADRTRGNSIDSGMMVRGVPSHTGQNSIKRAQYGDRNLNRELVASSSNAWARSFHGLDPLHNLESGLPQFAAGTDSENSEDQSCKSTAASAPKPNVDYRRETSVGFPHDERRNSRSGGKNVANAVHRGGNGRFRTSRKEKGERVKIEKENSHSSLESDSRSSNFILMQGDYSPNNGLLSGNQWEYDGENFSKFRGDHQVSAGHRHDRGRDGAAGFEGSYPEDTAAESSSEVKEVRHGSSSVDQDPLLQSIIELQSVQEALEKEVLKFKEIKEEISNDNFEDMLPYGEVLESSSRDAQSDELADRDVETEREDLFTRMVEAEVKYLALSWTVKRLKTDTENQITMLEEQNTLASEQAKLLDQLRDADSQGAMLRKGTKKLEVFWEGLARDDETVELQESVCKYSSVFLLQFALLVVIIGVIVSRLYPTNAEIVPT